MLLNLISHPWAPLPTHPPQPLAASAPPLGALQEQILHQGWAGTSSLTWACYLPSNSLASASKPPPHSSGLCHTFPQSSPLLPNVLACTSLRSVTQVRALFTPPIHTPAHISVFSGPFFQEVPVPPLCRHGSTGSHLLSTLFPATVPALPSSSQPPPHLQTIPRRMLRASGITLNVLLLALGSLSMLLPWAPLVCCSAHRVGESQR